MSPGASDPQQTRLRVGLAFLAVGIALLLFAWLSWIFRTSNPELPPIDIESRSTVIGSMESGEESRSGQHEAFIQAAPMLLLTTFLLIGVFLGGSLILVRGMRRRREASEQRRRVPTPSDDIWSMHPPQDDFDEHAA